VDGRRWTVASLDGGRTLVCRQAKCPSSLPVKRSVRQAKCPSSLPVVPWQAGKATVKRSDRLPFAVHRLKKTTDIIEKDENLF
jgi:hypothetical protein